MKISRPFLFCFIFSSFFTSISAKEQSVFDRLDEEIANSSIYKERKEQRIKILENNLSSSVNSEEKAQLEWKLFNEYRNYIPDSARRHAYNLLKLADEFNSSQSRIMALTGIMDTYTTQGFWKEANEINDRIATDSLSSELLPYYLTVAHRLYENLATYIGSDNPELKEIYEGRSKGYLVDLIESTGKYTYQHDASVADLDKTHGIAPEEEIERREKILHSYDLKNEERAEQYSKMALAALEVNDRLAAKDYLANAMILNIRSNAKSPQTLALLAKLMHEEGENNRAFRYIELAAEDAEIVDSPLDIAEIKTLYTRIDYDSHHFRNPLAVILILSLVAAFLLVILALFFYFKLKKTTIKYEIAEGELNKSRKKISNKELEIKDSQEQINKLILKLKESDEIKDRYIRETLYNKTSFLSNLEEVSKEIPLLLKSKKYEELKTLPSRFGIKEEKQRIYKSFDSAFLNLFPDFMEEINSLMPENNKISLDENGELPAEIRIFALIRLGVSEPSEIASFLGLSVKTVYVYKTKVKSRSIVENEEFENKILEFKGPLSNN